MVAVERSPCGVSVVFVVQSYPKLTETFIAAQREYLRAHVVVREYVGPGAAPAYVTVLPPVSGADRVGLLLRRFVRRLRFGKPASSYLSPGQEASLRDRLSELRPDVVLAHFGPSAIDAAPACAESGIPLVVHFHGADLSSYFASSGYRTEMRGALNHVQAAVVVNATMIARLGDHFPEFTKEVARIPYGVSVQQADVDRVADDRASCTFVAVGRLVPKKGILLTLEAFAKTWHEERGVRLVVVGDGPLLASAKALVDRRGLTPVVVFCGSLPHQEVLARLQRSDVFVQHSLTSPEGDEEGWPVAIAEAAGLGLPVVATRHAGIPEQVITETTGILVAEGDVDAMASAMLRLAREPELRRRMGSAASGYILTNFSRHQQLARLDELLLRSAANR